MADIKHSEHYEDVRDNYADNVAKANNTQKSVYIPRLTEILRKSDHQITVLDPNELLRVAFYFEDMAANEEKEPNFNEVPDWLFANFKRNPQFFGRFFRLRSNLKLPQKNIDERLPQVRADLSKLTNEKDKQKAEEKAKTQWDPKNKEIVVLTEPQNNDEPESVNANTDPNESVDIDEQLKSPYLMETNIADIVENIDNQQRQELKLQLNKIVETLLGVSMYNRDSLMSQLAERKMYQQLVAGLFQELGVESSYTSVEQGVFEKRLAFNIDHNYTFAEIRMGLPQAKVKIAELTQNGKDLAETQRKLKFSEGRVVQHNANVAAQTQTILKLQDEVLALKAIPKIQDGKLHYLYVCWDETVNNKQVRYYLATTNKETNNDGYYITKSFIKTIDRKTAIRFPSEDMARKQLQRIDKHYVKNINRSAGISLKEHIHKAYFVELVETCIKDAFIASGNES